MKLRTILKFSPVVIVLQANGKFIITRLWSRTDQTDFLYNNVIKYDVSQEIKILTSRVLDAGMVGKKMVGKSKWHSMVSRNLEENESLSSNSIIKSPAITSLYCGYFMLIASINETSFSKNKSSEVEGGR